MMKPSTRASIWTWVLYILIALMYFTTPVSGPVLLDQITAHSPITTPTVSIDACVAIRTSLPTPVKRIIYSPKVTASLSQTTLGSIRESPDSSFILPSQHPVKRSAKSWCEVCRAVRNLKPSNIFRPIVRSAISWSRHWYGAQTVTLVHLAPLSLPAPPPPPPPPPPTTTTPEDLPGSKTYHYLTPSSLPNPTRAFTQGLSTPLSSKPYIVILSASSIVICTLVTLLVSYSNAPTQPNPTPIPTPTPLPPQTPSLLDTSEGSTETDTLEDTQEVGSENNPPATPPMPETPIAQSFQPQLLPSPTITPDFVVTRRPARPARVPILRRRSVPIVTYDTCLKLFDRYTSMAIVQTDTTAYHLVPGLGRRVAFETSTESFIPEVQLLAEAERRVVDAVRNAQNMVRAMYEEVRAEGGSIEVDVRVVLEGLEIDEDDDGWKSVNGTDRYVYHFCFVVDLPPPSANSNTTPTQSIAPMGLLPAAEIVTSSVAGSVQYWPPVDSILTAPIIPNIGDAELPRHSELVQQPEVAATDPAPIAWPLKRKRSTETGALIMRRRGRVYRDSKVDNYPRAKKQRLDEGEADKPQATTQLEHKLLDRSGTADFIDQTQGHPMPLAV